MPQFDEAFGEWTGRRKSWEVIDVRVERQMERLKGVI